MIRFRNTGIYDREVSSVRMLNFSLEYYLFSSSLGRHDPRLAQRRLSEAAILPSIVQVRSEGTPWNKEKLGVNDVKPNIPNNRAAFVNKTLTYRSL